jgi:hypothetical protein
MMSCISPSTTVVSTNVPTAMTKVKILRDIVANMKADREQSDTPHVSRLVDIELTKMTNTSAACNHT